MGRLREILLQMQDPAFVTRRGTRQGAGIWQPEQPGKSPIPLPQGMQGKEDPNAPVRPSAFKDELLGAGYEESNEMVEQKPLTQRQQILRNAVRMRSKRKLPEESDLTLGGLYGGA